MAANAQQVRENTRDSATLLIGAMMVIVTKLFYIDDPELITACATILTVLCHRGVRKI